jgi:uncharacterized cupredoxin-like copper-binding protein
MQRFSQWLQGVLMRPRALSALIGCLTGLALVTTALAYMVGGPPTSAIPGSSTPSAQTGAVNVVLYDNRIESSQTTFTPGMRYHLTAVNKGTINHELMIVPQGMSQMPMEQMDRLALARTGDMAPGMTKSFDYTFTSAMAQQRLEFGCYYPGHYDAGMKLPIAVSK